MGFLEGIQRNIARQQKGVTNNVIRQQKKNKFFVTRVGERQTTPSQKRNIKEEQNFRCAVCGRSFKHLPKYLEIHHKREISKHKNLLGFDMPIYTQGKKHKLKYERRSNKVAICKDCHDKTKKRVKRKNLYALRY